MYNNRLKLDDEYYSRLAVFFSDDGDILDFAEKAFKENYWLFMNAVNIAKTCDTINMDWRYCIELIIQDIVDNRIDEWGFPELCGMEEHAFAAVATYLYYANK